MTVRTIHMATDQEKMVKAHLAVIRQFFAKAFAISSASYAKTLLGQVDAAIESHAGIVFSAQSDAWLRYAAELEEAGR